MVDIRKQPESWMQTSSDCIHIIDHLGLSALDQHVPPQVDPRSEGANLGLVGFKPISTG
ncbi:MAG: hypothetical protein IH586_05865 [Anaerolineaceae bacterium]|nr:hypothetical protein [Anaerolineaceae bacterium]